LSSVIVSIPFPPAVSTLEQLAAAVGLTLLRVDVQAFVAGLRRVGRRHQHHRHSSNGSLVGHKHPELVERPVIGSAALSFTPRFLIQALSDVCQVLKSQCRTNSLGIPDQGFADVMVQPLKFFFELFKFHPVSSKVLPFPLVPNARTLL
jgi:hypothetical protein